MPDKPPARARQPFLAAALAIAAMWAPSGCSEGNTRYPSLATRPAERLADSINAQAADPKPTAAPLAPPSAGLAARLDTLLTQAQAARRDFDGRLKPTETLVSAASGAAAGSENWARATQAMSALAATRTVTAGALTELDRIDVEDRLAHAPQDGTNDTQPPRSDAAAIARTRDTVGALVAEEDAALARLDGRLAR